MSPRRYRGRGSGPRPFEDRQNWVDDEPTPPIPFLYEDQGEAATAERDVEAGKDKENMNTKRPLCVLDSKSFCFICYVNNRMKRKLHQWFVKGGRYSWWPLIWACIVSFLWRVTFHNISKHPHFIFFAFQRSKVDRGFAICAKKRCIPTLHRCLERITG